MCIRDRNNIIPDKSQITGTIRTFDPDLRAEIYDEIRQIARGVAEGTGTKVDVEFDVGGFYPVTFNNVELTNKYSQTLSEAADGKFLFWINLQQALKTFLSFPNKYQACTFG